MERTNIMNRDSLRSYHRWHLIVSAILAALLFLLPMLTRIGPNSWKSCLPGLSAAAPTGGTLSADSSAMSAVTPAVAPPAVASPTAALPAASAPTTAIVATPPADAPPAAKVYFATAKFDVPRGADSTVAAVVGYLKSHPSAKALLSGFHDPRGSLSTNQALSFKRATSVRDLLGTLGITSGRVLLNKPQSTTGTGSLAEARRVEVSVQP